TLLRDVLANGSRAVERGLYDDVFGDVCPEACADEREQQGAAIWVAALAQHQCGFRGNTCPAAEALERGRLWHAGCVYRNDLGLAFGAAFRALFCVGEINCAG